MMMATSAQTNVSEPVDMTPEITFHDVPPEITQRSDANTSFKRLMSLRLGITTKHTQPVPSSEDSSHTQNLTPYLSDDEVRQLKRRSAPNLAAQWKAAFRWNIPTSPTSPTQANHVLAHAHQHEATTNTVSIHAPLQRRHSYSTRDKSNPFHNLFPVIHREAPHYDAPTGLPESDGLILVSDDIVTEKALQKQNSAADFFSKLFPIPVTLSAGGPEAGHDPVGVEEQDEDADRHNIELDPSLFENPYPWGYPEWIDEQQLSSARSSSSTDDLATDRGRKLAPKRSSYLDAIGKKASFETLKAKLGAPKSREVSRNRSSARSREPSPSQRKGNQSRPSSPPPTCGGATIGHQRTPSATRAVDLDVDISSMVEPRLDSDRPAAQTSQDTPLSEVRSPFPLQPVESASSILGTTSSSSSLHPRFILTDHRTISTSSTAHVTAQTLHPRNIKLLVCLGDSLLSGLCLTASPDDPANRFLSFLTKSQMVHPFFTWLISGEHRQNTCISGGAPGIISVGKMIRHFSPQLVGLSETGTVVLSQGSGYNFARSGSIVSNLNDQVRRLAGKLVEHQKDFRRHIDSVSLETGTPTPRTPTSATIAHPFPFLPTLPTYTPPPPQNLLDSWKMVVIWIGANDAVLRPDDPPAHFEKTLSLAIQNLRSSVSKCYAVLLTLPDLSAVAAPTTASRRENLRNKIKELNRVLEKVVRNYKWDTDDFRLVLVHVPEDEMTHADIEPFVKGAVDGTHPNVVAHQLFAKCVWNNLFEGAGKEQRRSVKDVLGAEWYYPTDNDHFR